MRLAVVRVHGVGILQDDVHRRVERHPVRSVAGGLVALGFGALTKMSYAAASYPSGGSRCSNVWSRLCL